MKIYNIDNIISIEYEKSQIYDGVIYYDECIKTHKTKLRKEEVVIYKAGYAHSYYSNYSRENVRIYEKAIDFINDNNLGHKLNTKVLNTIDEGPCGTIMIKPLVTINTVSEKEYIFFDTEEEAKELFHKYESVLSNKLNK